MIRWCVVILAICAGAVRAESPSVVIEPSGLAPAAIGITPAVRPEDLLPANPEPAPNVQAVDDAPQMDSEALLQMSAARMTRQISRCWNVGALAERGEVATVTVTFSMTRDGRPVIDSFELIETNANDPEVADLAFQAARRAVVRCAALGYDMPDALFARWQTIQVTFDPSEMRLR